MSVAYEHRLARRPRRALVRRAGRLAITLALFAASLLTLAPLIWALSTSLRLPVESFSLPPRWLPTDPDFGNYADVFDKVPFGRFVVNSGIVTFGIVAGQLATAALGGYAFARLRFPGRRVLFALVLATLMIPLQATIIPIFVLISKLQLSDTLVALIVPAWPTAFGIFLMRQYFMSLPDELEDAAVIDGAGPWQVFWHVYLRLATPGLAVLAILAFNFHWNEFFRPLVFLTSDENFTLPLGLVTLQGYLGSGSISVVLAGVILSLVPVLVTFFFGQRYLIEGILRGAIKG
jgi:multiple sugar transport system permease protein